MIKICFFAILCTFYMVYIGKMFALRQQGIKGDVLGKGTKPARDAIIEILLKVLTYTGACIQFLSVFFSNAVSHGSLHIFSVSLPISILSFELPLSIRIAGVAIGFAGVVFFIAAVVTMRNNWRAGFEEKQDTELVTNGIFGVSRNPAFVGFDLLYIGCMLAFPNIINIIISIAVIIIMHLQILNEEKFLAGVFGVEYGHYKNKVRRYL